jgi:MFS family permease
MYAYLVIPNRFATVFFQKRGVSAADVGALMAGFSISRWLGTVVFGAFADKYGVSPQSITLGIIPLSCAAFCAMFWESKMPQYWLTFCSFSFMFGPIAPLADSAFIGAVGTSEWGSLRANGAAAWGAMGAIVGELISRFGLVSVFVAASVSAGISWLLFCCVNLDLAHAKHSNESAEEQLLDKEEGKKELETQSDEDSSPSPPSLNEILCIPMRSFDLLMLHFTAISFGFIMASVQSLLLFFILDHLKGGTQLCGISILVTVLAELPIFKYISWFEQSLGGPFGMFVGAGAAYIVRVNLYTLLTPNTAWFLLGAEVLHGVTFALYNAGATASAVSLVPSNLRTSAISWVNGIYCIGLCCGSIVGGRVYDLNGPNVMFREYSALMAIVLGVLTIIRYIRLCTRLSSSGSPATGSGESGADPKVGAGLPVSVVAIDGADEDPRASERMSFGLAAVPNDALAQHFHTV